MPTHLSRRRVLSVTAKSVFASTLGLLAKSNRGPPSEAEINHKDVITPYQFGATGNGWEDDTSALQRSVTAAIENRKILDLSHGKYRVTASIVGRGDIRIVNSNGAVIEAANGRYEKGGVLVFEGRATLIGHISASASKGDRAVWLQSTAAFSEGDVGTIYDAADYSYSGFRHYYRAGEFFEVDKVTDRTLSLRAPLYDSYDHSAIEVHKIQTITGYIRDVRIKSKGASVSLIVIDYAKDFEIVGPLLNQAGNDCILLRRSIRCSVRHPKIHNEGDGGDDYGLVWSNSQHGLMVGGDVYARRHPVAMGGRDSINAVPCRDIVIRNATLRNDRLTRAHSADIHGNSEDCGYDGCTIFGGFSAQGKSSFLLHCTVFAMDIGTAVYAAELLGGMHVIQGNTFHFDTDPFEASRGAIDFGGNSDAITSDTTGDLTIVVRDNTFVSSAFGPNTMMLYARNAGTDAKINIRFIENELRVNDFSAAVRLRLAKGTATSDFVEVDCSQTNLVNRRKVHLDGAYSGLALSEISRFNRC